MKKFAVKLVKIKAIFHCGRFARPGGTTNFKAIFHCSRFARAGGANITQLSL
jgi:hypothetical protein